MNQESYRKKNYIRHLLRDMPINTKILVSIMVFVLLPFFIVSMISYSRLTGSISENMQGQADHSVSVAAEKINRQMTGALAIGDMLKVDQALLALMQQDFSSDLEYYLAYHERIYPSLDQAHLMFPDFTAVSLYTSNQTILSGGGVYHNEGREQIDTEVDLWYKPFLDTGKDIALISYTSGRSDRLSLVYRLMQAEVSNYDVLLKVDFSPELIRSMLMTDIENAQLVLADAEGRPLISASTAGEATPLTADGLSIRTSVSAGDRRLGWQVQGEIADIQMLRSAAEARHILYLLMLFGVGGTIALYRFMYRYYIKQINLLLKHMNLVKEQQFVTIPEGMISSDELGQLMRRFNEMTHEISRLINDVYKLDADKKNLEIENIRAELLNLQSQMDPHFMYNTLSAMMVVSMKENYPKLVDIIYYLSRLLRRMVDREDPNVTIHEEIVFTEMYLRIEAFRFREQFSYQIDIQPETEDWVIPKFSIQPLVENACKHGIHARSKAGRVAVRVFEEGDELWIVVTDNGNGFSLEQLQKVRQEMVDFSKASASVGLRNIYMRLYYDYRDHFAMNIESVENEGSEVTIRLKLDCLEKSKEHFDIPLDPGGGILQ